MEKSKVKKIFQQLFMAVVVIGFCNISAQAQSVTANSNETYKLGGHGRLHISLEHYKERDGYTPVLIAAGGLRILKWMDRNGSVTDSIGNHSGDQWPLFRIDLNEWQILTGNESIPFEVTVQDNTRTRMIINGNDANAVVNVDKDQKNGELYLFNNSVKLANLRFKRVETANGKQEVKIFGADIRASGKFIFEKDSKTIYSLREYNRLEKAKERAQKKALAASQRQGKSIPSLERQALIALYNSTNGDSWYCNDGWKDPPLEPDGFAAIGSEGTWYGITVESDHVTQIYLWSNKLVDTLPIELGNLSRLKGLYLGENLLTGSIPSELGNLSNLEHLWLTFNQISGVIPAELGNLSSLKGLYLDENLLTGSIPVKIGDIINLENLNLDYNQLTGSIPAELGNLSNLKELRIGYNLLSGSIPPELGNLSNLEELYLYCNSLSGSIPVEFGNLSNLEYLGLSHNQLTGVIPAELDNLSNLKSLQLYHNQLSGSIPVEFGNLSNLEYLGLSHNQLTGVIPAELGNISNLKSLQLNHNQLSGSIPPELGNLSDLTGLTISRNSFSGSIPTELGNLSNMYSLSLNYNSLIGSIPSELGNLSNLGYLNICGNILSGEIPTSLTNLKDPYLIINIGYNALYTNDGALITFLNEKDSDWAETQTIAPTNVSSSPYDTTSIRVSWTPITYSSDPGGYMVFYSTTSGGPYTYFGITTDKTVSSMIVTGLTPGAGYYFVVQTRTDSHWYNDNTVDSEYSSEVSVDGNQDMHVKLKNKNILNGSTLNAGTKPLSRIVGLNIPFTIQNRGFNTLDLTGSPDMVTLSGAAAKFFMVTQQPLTGTIAPGGSTTFKIRTKKTTVPNVPDGWQKNIQFTVNIPNTDPDENPYTFTIKITLVK